MPHSPPRLCPRCRQPVRGRCPTCLPAQRATTDRHRGTAASRGYDHHWRERVRKPFLRDNPLCVLCGALANVPDHWPTTRRSLIAAGATDPDAAHRLRALCDDCHNTHGARDNRPNSNVTVVAGPPCAGKNTYIDQHGCDGDKVIDYDQIMQSLIRRASHLHDAQRKGEAHDIRDAAITQLLRSGNRGWVINSAPIARHRHQYGTRVILLLTPRDVCLERAQHGRPIEWQNYIHDWFERYEPDPRDEVIEG